MTESASGRLTVYEDEEEEEPWWSCRFMDISSHCGEFTSLEAATWADRGEGLEFEVGTCDPRIPSAIDVGVR